MRFFSEYALYFVATLIAIVVFVKPITKSHWPFIAKLAFYAISGILFISILLFEYFTKTSLADIVREAVGSTVCYIYPMRACPQEMRGQARAKQPEQPPPLVAPVRAPPLAPPTTAERVTPQPEFPSPTQSLPAKRDPACKTTKDQLLCEVRSDCTWVSESTDETGKVKAKAYCRARPKEPAKKPEPKI